MHRLIRFVPFISIVACCLAAISMATVSLRGWNNNHSQFGVSRFAAKPSKQLFSVSTDIQNSVVVITANGFAPTVITTTVGVAVEWRNATTTSVFLYTNPAHLLFLPLVKGEGNSQQQIGLRRPRTTEVGMSSVVSATIPPGGIYQQTFSIAGTYPFYLGSSAHFSGQVVVLPGDPSATPLPIVSPPSVTATATATASPTPAATATPTKTHQSLDPLLMLGSASPQGADAHLGYDIHPGTGNLYLSALDIIAVPALGPRLIFERHYNSQGMDTNVGLGYGWTHTYSWRVSMPDQHTVRLLTHTGRTISFASPSGGPSWAAPVGEFGTLTGTGQTGFVYTEKYGTVYTFDTMAQAGRLLSITPADNTSILITYLDAIRIERVTSDGMALSFTYNGDQIQSIRDPDNQQWVYEVSQTLDSVTYPNGDSLAVKARLRYLYQDSVVNGTTFFADNPGRLTRILQRQSANVEIDRGIFSYEQGRLVRVASSAVNGSFQNELKLSYFQPTLEHMVATATLAGGAKTITLQQIANQWRITQINATAGTGYGGAEWTTTNLSWNNNLTLATVTDGNGTVTAYQNYDLKGNPQTVIEDYGRALARTTTLTYHSVLSSPLTISRRSVDGKSEQRRIFDYDGDYDTSYNTAPTTYLHQIVESGKTDTSLSGSPGTLAVYTTRLTYDAAHRLTQMQDADGNIQSFEYWSADNETTSNRLHLVSVSPQPGQFLTWTADGYDKNGRLTLAHDVNGVGTFWLYDAVGNVLARNLSTEGQGQMERFQYNLANQLTDYVTAGNTHLRFEYDLAGRIGRRWAETGAASPTTPWTEVYSYDDQNNLIVFRRLRGLGALTGKTCTPSGEQEFCLERAFDNFQRLAAVRTLSADNQVCTAKTCTVTYAYDHNSNLLSSTKAGTATTSYQYDALNRLVRLTQPTGDYGTLVYDQHDYLISYQDPRDAVNGGSGGDRHTTYTYDDFGRMIAMQSPDTGLLRASYNGRGLRTHALDAAGNLTTYVYDGVDRLVKLEAPVEQDSVTYEYDQVGEATGLVYANTAGRLTTVTTYSGERELVLSRYSYDFLGRISDQVETRGPLDNMQTHTFHYQWGTNGELLSLTYPDGAAIDYQYATNNGFAPKPKPSGVSTTFAGGPFTLASEGTYFADGVLERLVFGNGSVRTLTRNQRSQWTHLVSGPVDNPVVDQRYEYTADGLGLLKAVHHYAGTARAWDWGYSYDARNRLVGYATNVRATPDTYTWAYDEVGNRTTQSVNGLITNYHYAAANDQLISLSGAETDTWSHDANGFVNRHTSATGVIDYTYDSRGLLTRLTDTSSGEALATYHYDGALRPYRTEYKDGSTREYFYSPNGLVLQERVSTGALENGSPTLGLINYVYLADIEVARLLRKYHRPCPACEYTLEDVDIHFVHEDFRRSPFAIEGRYDNTVGWMGEIDPFGTVKSSGRPGPDGKIGTPDDASALFPNVEDLYKSRFEAVDKLVTSVGGRSAWTQPTVGQRLGGPSGALDQVGQIEQGRSSFLQNLGARDLSALGGRQGSIRSNGAFSGLMRQGKWKLLATDTENKQNFGKELGDNMVTLSAPLDALKIAVGGVFGMIGATVGEAALLPVRVGDAACDGCLLNQTELKDKTLWGIVWDGIKTAEAENAKHLTGGHSYCVEGGCGDEATILLPGTSQLDNPVDWFTHPTNPLTSDGGNVTFEAGDMKMWSPTTLGFVKNFAQIAYVVDLGNNIRDGAPEDPSGGFTDPVCAKPGLSEGC